MEALIERIRYVFERSEKNKSEIARMLNVTPAYISKLTIKDDAAPSSRFISDVCIKFRINEQWLRTGEGEMLETLDEDQELAEFSAEIMRDKPESFRKRFVCALRTLGPDDWAVLEKIADELAKRKTVP